MELLLDSYEKKISKSFWSVFISTDSKTRMWALILRVLAIYEALLYALENNDGCSFNLLFLTFQLLGILTS